MRLVERQRIADPGDDGVADAFLPTSSQELAAVVAPHQDADLRALGDLVAENAREIGLLFGEEQAGVDQHVDPVHRRLDQPPPEVPRDLGSSGVDPNHFRLRDLRSPLAGHRSGPEVALGLAEERCDPAPVLGVREPVLADPPLDGLRVDANLRCKVDRGEASAVERITKTLVRHVACLQSWDV